MKTIEATYGDAMMKLVEDFGKKAPLSGPYVHMSPLN
jgi:hypothetical protein